MTTTSFLGWTSLITLTLSGYLTVGGTVQHALGSACLTYGACAGIGMLITRISREFK